MKWYKYLFFYCLVFFCFSCNVFGISVKDEKYPKDCDGNVITKIDNTPRNNPINSNDSCSIDLNSKVGLIYDNSKTKDNPHTCASSTPSSDEKKRSILLLIDNSYSMYNEGGKKWKVREVRKIFRKIATQMEPNDHLYIKYFKNNGCSNCKGDYSKSQAVSDQEKISKQILEYTPQGKDCNTPLCYGTPTYSVEALQKAKDFVDHKVKKSVPIVIFITDGYPTSYGDYNLGYLSSARHFYEFAVGMKQLKNSFVSLKTKIDGNSFIANGSYIPKFVTVGLGVNNNANYSAKYLLSTSFNDRISLKNIASSSKPAIKQKYREDKKFYNLLMATENKEKYEITASIASNPDLGVAGSDVDKDDEKITFSKNGLSIINEDLTDNGVAFGPIKVNKITNVKYYDKKNGRCQIVTKRSNQLKTRELDGDYKNYKVIILDYNECLLKHDVTINLNAKVSSSLKKYNLGKDRIGSYLDGFVTKFYNQREGNSLSLGDISEILKYKKDDVATTPSKISYTNIIHTGISSDIKSIDLGVGYVRHCDKLTNDNQTCSTRKVKLFAKYFIDYSVTFDGGTLKNNNNYSYSPGTGFQFQNLKTTVDRIWYFTGYADEKKEDPIIEYQVGNKFYKINYNSVYHDSNLKDEFITRDDLWQEISAAVEKETKNSSVYSYKTVNSNKPDETKFDITNKIYSLSSSRVYKDTDTHYETTKIDSIKKSCIKGTNFEYVDENKNCPAGYSQTDSYAGENFSYIKKNDRYYFIPFGYKQDTVDVTVELNVVGKELSTTCSIKVNDGGSPCKPTNSSEPKSIEDQVSYRSIDKDNPFPRANNKYYSIPINWRSWYCSSSGTSGNCIPNTEKQKRLSNSYSNIYYSKKYSSQDLTNIAKQTLSDSKVYYSSWNNIVNITGKSNSIGATNSDSTKIIEEKFGSTKSYCPLGSFKENCDQVMLK